jgi:hypothetical protein
MNNIIPVIHHAFVLFLFFQFPFFLLFLSGSNTMMKEGVLLLLLVGGRKGKGSGGVLQCV